MRFTYSGGDVQEAYDVIKAHVVNNNLRFVGRESIIVCLFVFFF